MRFGQLNLLIYCYKILRCITQEIDLVDVLPYHLVIHYVQSGGGLNI